MATTLVSPKVAVSATAGLTGGAAPATSSSSPNHAVSWAPTVGTAAGNADKIYSAAFTVTSGTPLVLDMTSLLDPLGGAVNFAHVLAVIISNDSVTAGQIFTVGGGTTPVLGSDQLTVQPNGGVGAVINPNPGYTTASANLLKILVAAGTAVAGKITIIGRST